MSTLNWSAVKSGNLDEAAYDPATQELRVRFKSGYEYQYNKVPGEVWDRFSATFGVQGEASVYFRENIRDWKGGYEKIEKDKQESE